MTYKELAKLIAALPEDKQNMDVTALLEYEGEIVPVKYFGYILEGGDYSDVLEVGHPVLEIEF